MVDVASRLMSWRSRTNLSERDKMSARKLVISAAVMGPLQMGLLTQIGCTNRFARGHLLIALHTLISKTNQYCKERQVKCNQMID